MKKLFVYYSLSGNTEYVASEMIKKGYDTVRLETVKPMPKNMLLCMLKGGYHAGLHHEMKIKEPEINMDQYDDVVIGVPIWNGQIACPMNTFLNSRDISGKKQTFILCSAGGKAKKADKYLEEKFPDAARIHLKQPKSFPEETAKELMLID